MLFWHVPCFLGYLAVWVYWRLCCSIHYMVPLRLVMLVQPCAEHNGVIVLVTGQHESDSSLLSLRARVLRPCAEPRGGHPDCGNGAQGPRVLACNAATVLQGLCSALAGCRNVTLRIVVEERDCSAFLMPLLKAEQPCRCGNGDSTDSKLHAFWTMQPLQCTNTGP